MRPSNKLRSKSAPDGVIDNPLRPLAFGGARATILAPDGMDDSAVAVTGDLYLALGARIYALELTLRECAGQYVVTDFWKCAPVDTTPTDTWVDTVRRKLRFRRKALPV